MIKERYEEIVGAIGSELFSGDFDPNALRKVVVEKCQELEVSDQEAREFVGLVLQKKRYKEEE